MLSIAPHFDGDAALNCDFPTAGVWTVVMTRTKNNARTFTGRRTHITILPASDTAITKVYDRDSHP